MLTIKEIATAIKGSILFHTKGVTEMSKADEIFDQLRMLNESVLRQYLSLKNLKDTIDYLEAQSKPIIPTITITKTPKALKLEAEEEKIKSKDIELTREELHEMFEYRDGDLYWKIRPSSKIKIGSKAGNKHYNQLFKRFVYGLGYKGKHYKVSRIIFKMFHGWTPEVVDFIDGNYLNTKIENLREINRSQSQYGRKKAKNNNSGYKGVATSGKKWVAQIAQHRKIKYLGTFNSSAEAHKAYKQAAKKLHGEFANFG
jgi:hypothetical protein